MTAATPAGSGLTAGLLKVNISENRDQLGKQSARHAGDLIRRIQEKRTEVNIIFASAPSQNEFLSGLIAEEGIEWNRINAFHMDEYIGLDAAAPQNFGKFLEERLFDHVPVKKFYRINGNAEDIGAEINRYAALLETFPADLICMGIGENCHIAFNDPHVADFNDTVSVKVVGLDAVSRHQQVHDGCFAALEEVPEKALTLTIPALMRPPHVCCMVPGTHKAEAVRHTLEDAVSELYPSTILRKHPDAFLFIDRDSASLLK